MWSLYFASIVFFIFSISSWKFTLMTKSWPRKRQSFQVAAAVAEAASASEDRRQTFVWQTLRPPWPTSWTTWWTSQLKLQATREWKRITSSHSSSHLRTRKWKRRYVHIYFKKWFCTYNSQNNVLSFWTATFFETRPMLKVILATKHWFGYLVFRYDKNEKKVVHYAKSM